jgi:hypothetical protein
MAFWLFFRTPVGPSPAQSLPRGVEIALFSLILLIALVTRSYHIDALPAGMHTDQGLSGLSALRILHEGWRPFAEVFDFEVPEVLLFYQLAGWFGLVGSSYLKFHVFFILLSLATFPLVYWTLRQWAGPRAALLSLFFLAIMRWNWIMTRNGYPSIQVPFYLFGALAFWTYGLRKDKRWAFYVSALFVGTGFYTYQAFKIVPFLMVLYAVDEALHQKKKALKPFLLYFLLVLAVITPLLALMIQKGRIGYREQILFLGTQAVQEKSLKPVWEVWTGTALMANRSGDDNPRHNLPGRRMLDDGTGVLFLLGLAICWRRRREPGSFYPLVGFSVMALTSLLTTQPAHANRLVSLTPFVAFFAGTAGLFFWEKLKHLGSLRWGLAVPFLAAITAQNAYTYFVEQANSEECRTAFGVEQTFVGRDIEDIASHGVNCNFFIDPAFFRNHTIAFLSYPLRERVFPFQPEDWRDAMEPKDKAALLFLDKDKQGWKSFLRGLFGHYPGIPHDSLQGVRPWTRGLRGVYVRGSGWSGTPEVIRVDPMLDFTSKFDFPFTQGPPFRIRWTGRLEVSKPGNYLFHLLTTDRAQLFLDGRTVSLERPLPLGKGAHTLRLDLAKDDGSTMVLQLIWKKPGAGKWEVVPATAFGKAR